MVNLTRAVSISPKVITLGFLSLLILSACQQTIQEGPRFTSDKGVKIEALLPEDIFMLAKVGTRDQGQIDNLKTLNAFFPNNPLGVLVTEFNNGFKEGANLQEIGLDYEKDLLPILKERSEAYLALAPGEGDAPESLKGVLAFTMGDTSKMDALMRMQVEKGGFQQAQYDGQEYFSEKNGTAFVTRLEDTLFVTTDFQTLKNGLDSHKKGENALENNQAYQRAIADYRSSVAFVYGDFGKLVEFVKRAGVDGEAISGSLNMIGLEESGVDAIESETIILTVEKEGIRLAINVKAKAGADLRGLTGELQKAYLLKKISVKHPLLYAEGYNFRQSYDKFAQIAETEPEMQAGLRQMEETLNSYGLNFQEDILTFLDRGYAVTLEDTDSVIPALAFYVDASSNVAGAEKTMRKIDESLSAFWEQIKIESPEITMVMGRQEVIPERLWKFRLNLDALVAGQSENMVKKLSGQKIEFYYGLLPDNTLVVALKSDLENVFGKSPLLTENEEFKRARGYVKNAEYGLSYLSPAQLFIYLDRVVELARAEGAPASDFADYEKAKAYIKPLKSLVSGSQAIEKDQTSAELFLHIAQ